MKCDNCGNEFKNSLKCPLCGHRQAKVSHCPVCQNVIHYGQPRCSNCGNPTKYDKKIDISKKYTSSYNTANKINYNQHSQSSHVYQQQEMYDYKSSNNEIKKRLEEARQRINNINFPVTKKRSIDETKVRNIIVGIVAVFTAAVFIFGQLFNSGRDYKDLSSLQVQAGNDILTQQGNLKNGGYAYLGDGVIYLGMDYHVYRSGANFSSLEIILDSGERDIYGVDDYVYYNQYGVFTRYDLNTNKMVGLFEMKDVMPADKNRFLYTVYEEQGLFLFDELTMTSTKLADGDIIDYSYDVQDGLVFYMEIDGSEIQTVDLNGNKGEQFDLSSIGQIYVKGDYIYYQDYYGIHCYNIENQSDELIVEDEVSNYIVATDLIIYTNYDNELFSYDGDITSIDDDVSVFNVVGNLVVYSRGLGDEYLENWYVNDFYGESLAKLNNFDDE